MWEEELLNYHEVSINKHPSAIHWDNNIFFSTTDTIANIKTLYELFELSGFNEQYIKEYHLMWMDKLKELKSI